MLVTSVTYVAGWVIGDLALRRRLGGLRTRETFGPVAADGRGVRGRRWRWAGLSGT